MTTAQNEFSSHLPDSKMSFHWVISSDARVLIKIHCVIFSPVLSLNLGKDLKGMF